MCLWMLSVHKNKKEGRFHLSREDHNHLEVLILNDCAND